MNVAVRCNAGVGKREPRLQKPNMACHIGLFTEGLRKSLRSSKLAATGRNLFCRSQPWIQSGEEHGQTKSDDARESGWAARVSMARKGQGSFKYKIDSKRQL